MNIARKALSWLCLYLVPTILFIFVNLFVVFAIFDRQNIKDTLHQENTYSKVVPSLLSLAGPTNTSAGQIPLDEPWVREVADRAFPASDLQQKGETLVDSNFDWLDGQTEQPQYRLDFTDNKQRLANEVAGYTQARLTSLPRCTSASIPDEVDVFKISCLPFGASPEVLAGQVRQQIINDQGFLKDPVITSDSLSSGISGSEQIPNPFEQLNGLRDLYQNRQPLLLSLPLLATVLIALGIYLSIDRARGLRRLARMLIPTGIGLIVFGLLSVYALSRLFALSTRDAVSKDIIAPVMVGLAEQARTIYLVAGIITLLISVVIILVSRHLAGQSVSLNSQRMSIK